MKFLLGQRFFNNFFVQLELFRIQETTKKIKLKKNKLSPRKLNILYGIIIIISYFLKVLLDLFFLLYFECNCYHQL